MSGTDDDDGDETIEVTFQDAAVMRQNDQLVARTKASLRLFKDRVGKHHPEGRTPEAFAAGLALMALQDAMNAVFGPETMATAGDDVHGFLNSTDED